MIYVGLRDDIPSFGLRESHRPQGFAFHSALTNRIQPVYDFVRESLSASAREQVFTLYQPPRTLYPEKPVPVPAAPKHINPAMKAHVVQPAGYNSRGTAMQGGTGGNESLSQLGLVPQSVLLLKWEDASLNGTSARWTLRKPANRAVSDAPAPLTDELRAKAAPLPAAAPKQETTTDSSKLKKLTGGTGDVKMPKWVQRRIVLTQQVVTERPHEEEVIDCLYAWR